MREGNKILYVIPARGGSKGVPGKNIKRLNGKPLIYYTLEVARSLASDEDICVSTDDENIKNVVEQTGLKVPFLRPGELATDQSGMYEVLLHALDYYTAKGKKYDLLVLLQPTSPFRKTQHIKEALRSWESGLEMVVGTKITKANPYYVLFEENSQGYLVKSKTAAFKTRQECPVIYEVNGAIYVIDTNCLLNRPITSFERIKKYVMDEFSSLDIDTMLDWKFAEFLFTEDK
jgi:CMP-N,N'-diacetyllegionaminic acid synthase